MAVVSTVKSGLSQMLFNVPISDMNWGERIAEARNAVGMKQGHLAAAIGSVQQTVGGWEKNKAEPGLENFARIAQVTGYRAAWLAFGEEPKKADASADPTAPPPSFEVREALFKIVYAMEITLAREGLRMSPEDRARVVVSMFDLQSALPDGSALLAQLERLVGISKKADR